MFAAPERPFAPNVHAHKAQKKSALLDSSAVSIPKMAKCVLPLALSLYRLPFDSCALSLSSCSNQELGKEEKILTGTFHDGDSE